MGQAYTHLVQGSPATVSMDCPEVFIQRSPPRAKSVALTTAGLNSVDIPVFSSLAVKNPVLSPAFSNSVFESHV